MLYEQCLNIVGLLIIVGAIVNFCITLRCSCRTVFGVRTVLLCFLCSSGVWLVGLVNRWSSYAASTAEPWFYAFPVVTKYETLAFVLFLVVSLTYFFTRKLLCLRSFLWLLGGFCLIFLNYLYSPNTTANFVPSLKSGWLVIHISLSFLAYAMFALAASVNGFALLTGRCEYVSRLSERLVAYGTVLFTIGGIFIGAVWADQSWGRFWAWDPKESWAFVTWVVYSAIWHICSADLGSYKTRSLLVVAAFGVVLFTYFGVNALYLDSLHSYTS